MKKPKLTAAERQRRISRGLKMACARRKTKPPFGAGEYHRISPADEQGIPLWFGAGKRQ
jgi:hypothetical protein